MISWRKPSEYGGASYGVAADLFLNECGEPRAFLDPPIVFDLRNHSSSVLIIPRIAIEMTRPIAVRTKLKIN